MLSKSDIIRFCENANKETLTYLFSSIMEEYSRARPLELEFELLYVQHRIQTWVLEYPHMEEISWQKR